MKQVTVYINSNCRHCKIYIQYLLRLHISFTIKDIFQNKKVIDELRNKNVLTVPVLFVDDNFVIGFDKEKIENILSIFSLSNANIQMEQKRI